MIARRQRQMCIRDRANDLFDELDRMADKVEDNHAGIQATEEIDTEAALEELKRRMKPES